MAAPRLVERHPGIVNLAIRNRAGIVGYRLNAAVDLDTAYTAPTAMITVPKNATFRSATLRQKKIGSVPESNRGLTRIVYDPSDFVSAAIPGDSDISFLNLQEESGVGFLPRGPILVVPPSGFLAAGRRNLILNGTAPNVSGLANNLPPQDAMRIVFPRYVDTLVIHADGTQAIALSFGQGLQEISITAGQSMSFGEVGTDEIYLRGVGGVSAFRLISTIVNGIEG
tara:strand:- start:454 stop:1131 length:678 start_codon:yes stop_codon:yes gene_type:complete